MSVFIGGGGTDANLLHMSGERGAAEEEATNQELDVLQL